jgi:subtilisin-like proprotein convertase family protein
MAAATYNFQIEQGSHFEINFRYLSENNSPINLSDKCIVLRWLEAPTAKLATFSSATPASLDNSSGYSLSGNNLGIINFQISSTQTKNYNFTNATYDLDIIESSLSSSKNLRLLTGTIGLITRNFSIVENCGLISSDPRIPLDADAPAPSVTVAPTGGVSPTPTAGPDSTDLCLPEDCISLDIYATTYTGSGFIIQDNQNNSSIISTSATGMIENIELAINGLRHDSPQDLTFILSPPSGSGILLSANSKIPNRSIDNGFSFMFSNKASVGSYLHNINNGGLCNIYDKTNIVKFNEQNLLNSFDHIINSSITGSWTLYANDNDVGVSGTIDSWKLILTYPSVETNGD